MSKRNIIAIAVLFVVLLGAIFVTLFLMSSNQDTRSDASTALDTTFPVITDVPAPLQTQSGQESTDPGTVENVSVNYPYINGDEADFTSASCTWDSNINAFQYNLKVTEVDTNSVIKEQVVNSGVLSDVFDVVPNNTYRCEVAAINSAGVAGVAGVDEQVCEVQAEVSPSPSPVVTVQPTATPTATLAPQAPVVTKPPLPPTGSVGTIATVGLGGLILLLIGGALLFL